MDPSKRPAWQRALWLALGVASFILGMIGIVVPVLPTVPFVLFAAFCFSRSSARLERWLLEHPRLGPPIRAWRESRSISRRAKQLAVVTMTISSALAWWVLPTPWRWLPASVCAVVGTWLLTLPTTARRDA
ncbi:MAG TPA: YbaN family protein [Burkholderiaceae bacterium]|nr:YbaN family protein [Burkholderiaceae bacterium]